MMNLKSIHFKSFSDEPVVLELSKKGPISITAADFKKNSNIEIMNPDAHIITLDKSADLYMGSDCRKRSEDFARLMLVEMKGTKLVGLQLMPFFHLSNGLQCR